MNQKVSNSYIIILGLMLFSLFFGAGNLIFPIMMGQEAGINVWEATAGFVITGVGLPLLAVIALGYSGKSDLQSLASRVHPMFGLIFSIVLYLAIGPLFAIPRAGSVSFEIGIRPLLPESWSTMGLFVFSIFFFGVAASFSLNSSKIVDIVGKYLTPIKITFILLLIVVAIFNPLGSFQEPIERYTENSFFNGFSEGYLTMDVLAAFVFGIIVINALRSKGVESGKVIMVSTMKAGLIAAVLLAFFYSAMAYMGASSVAELGILNNGGSVLSGIANVYFGSFGGIILSGVMIVACLTTSVGLISSCATYFNETFPKISYRSYVIIFAVFSAAVANFGLSQLIAISVPVLTAIYPLAIVLLILTFFHNAINGKKEVYQMSMLFTFIVSVFDGLNAAGFGVKPVDQLFTSILPLYEVGLGWIIPAFIGVILGIIIGLFKRGSKKKEEEQFI
ncbi:branched-chain amino acid:cation transporter, LIVCS family [Cytobacillus horneckiae]|uniref:Branched-chain amino acid transport system carrier protein n=1 Tax=Cytobacillus horneckiae TaxID=549687 RepID=A0A2N0ZJN9_9BACI|nr:branched-chain amino acid transport system II carrier protein [Cytobacillus horneckiae]MBN6888619.1 branched-chain amino acid transport system II carrier protein [Cytobacillus horneckiae]MCM3180525.1 branched-chain amino acid transport system II carrier protein [Cytobacillus horneckiae]MEC1158903.1 branched-chain amino acid transport system II carrier protein [Cytobacillus horneckiae]MED2938676.1 branched-chain amino acid transport system II carrier protein [Cytobacillus horneckiae]PKG29722